MRSVVTILALFGFALVAILGIYVCKRYPLDGGTYVFNRFESTDGVFLVAGRAHGPLEGWEMKLYVKKGSQPWAVYYLNHESPYWSEVRIEQNGEHIHISNSNALVGDLNLNTMLIDVPARKIVDAPPIYAIRTSDPLDKGVVLINPENDQWPNEWPKPHAYTRVR